MVGVSVAQRTPHPVPPACEERDGVRGYGGLAVPVSGEVFVDGVGMLVLVIGGGVVGCGGGGGGGVAGAGCGTGGAGAGNGGKAAGSVGTVPVVSSAIGFPN